MLQPFFIYNSSLNICWQDLISTGLSSFQWRSTRISSSNLMLFPLDREMAFECKVNICKTWKTTCIFVFAHNIIFVSCFDPDSFIDRRVLQQKTGFHGCLLFLNFSCCKNRRTKEKHCSKITCHVAKEATKSTPVYRPMQVYYNKWFLASETLTINQNFQQRTYSITFKYPIHIHILTSKQLLIWPMQVSIVAEYRTHKNHQSPDELCTQMSTWAISFCVYLFMYVP